MQMLRATLAIRAPARLLLPVASRNMGRVRTFALASDAGTTSNVSVDKLVIQEHDKARKLFEDYDKARSSDEKQMLSYHIIRELSMHSAKEEEVIYPVIARVFGEEMRDHLLAEHQVLKDNLDKLSGMTRVENEMQFDQLVRTVRDAFVHHIKDEEEKEIPNLLKSPGVDAVDLGRQFQEAAAHATTRPHPLAPNKPPANIAAHIATAPFDKVADAVRFKQTSM